MNESLSKICNSKFYSTRSATMGELIGKCKRLFINSFVEFKISGIQYKLIGLQKFIFR